ncbi:MAG: methyltransferase domain-containing protein [Patescibacteria group bacterium]
MESKEIKKDIFAENNQAEAPKKIELTISGDQTFFTKQGEGVNAGKPAVFLRLHYCNLDCTWCDTPYTWNKEMPEFHDEKEKWNIEKTTQRIKKSWDEGMEQRKLVSQIRVGSEIQPQRTEEPTLVITGGEPMVQQKRLVNLINQPELSGWHIEIETNGTIKVPEDFPDVQFNCSPKLSNSGLEKSKRINEKALQSLINRDTNFKFVVEEEKDIDEIVKDYLPILKGISRDKIYIMPQGDTAEKLDVIKGVIEDRTRLEGFNLSDRLQVREYGSQRESHAINRPRTIQLNDYDSLAERYRQSDIKPDKQYSMLPTILKMAGNLNGKRVLDLGSGNGFFTKEFSVGGADKVIGIDNSIEQINLATKDQPGNVKYILGDIFKDLFPKSDIISAPYVLNYSDSKEQLFDLYKKIYNSLADEGKFIAIVDLPEGRDLKRFGAEKTVIGGMVDEARLQIDLYNDDKYICTLNSVYYTPETIEEGLKKAGFSHVEWIKPVISEEGKSRLGVEFWEGYLDGPELGYIEATK